MQLANVSSNGNAIQSYGPEKFVISGEDYATSLLMTDQFLAPFDVLSVAEISVDTLAPLLALSPRIEVLIIGTGARMQRVPEPLRMALRTRGLSVDAMDTGAACRTYAILQSEGRRVGAALLLPKQ
jgi:uncharacterized protein